MEIKRSNLDPWPSRDSCQIRMTAETPLRRKVEVGRSLEQKRYVVPRQWEPFRVAEQPNDAVLVKATDAPVQQKKQNQADGLAQEKEREVCLAFKEFLEGLYRSSDEAVAFDINALTTVYSKYKDLLKFQTFREFAFENIRKQLVLACPKVEPRKGQKSQFDQFLEARKVIYRDFEQVIKNKREAYWEADEESEKFHCLDALAHCGFALEHNLALLSLPDLINYCAEIDIIRLNCCRSTVRCSADAIIGKLVAHGSEVLANTIDRVVEVISSQLLIIVKDVRKVQKACILSPWQRAGSFKQHYVGQLAVTCRQLVAEHLADLKCIKRLNFNPSDFQLQNYFFVRALNSLNSEDQQFVLWFFSRSEKMSFLEVANIQQLIVDVEPAHLDRLNDSINKSLLIFGDEETNWDERAKAKMLLNDQLEALRVQLAVDKRLSAAVLLNVRIRYDKVMAKVGEKGNFKQFLIKNCGYSETQLKGFAGILK